MARYRPKKTHKNIKDLRKSIRTKRRPKDLDQIQDELKNPDQKQSIDADKPGLGQFYCVSCARYFVGAEILAKHVLTRPHKRRLKLAMEEQYTQREAEAGAGMSAADRGILSRPGRKIRTVPVISAAAAAVVAPTMAVPIASASSSAAAAAAVGGARPAAFSATGLSATGVNMMLPAFTAPVAAVATPALVTKKTKIAAAKAKKGKAGGSKTVAVSADGDVSM